MSEEPEKINNDQAALYVMKGEGIGYRIYKAGFLPYWWATGTEGSGRILFYPDKKEAQAQIPITSILQRMSNGVKKEGNHFKIRDAGGNISVETLYLALLSMPKDREVYRDMLIDAINQHPHRERAFVACKKELEIKDGVRIYSRENESSYDQFETFAKEWLFKTISGRGKDPFKDALSILEKFEKAWRELHIEESDFLKALNKAASEILDVPAQMDVFGIWSKDNLTREAQRKQFDGIKVRLGFDWLPPIKRGKNAIH